ncbi:MAG TPA: hypothetical protein VFC19_43380 [Candidatus Limnocylindrales bacterium]|nr:hypothetical protein [Candidatus Limnocylindrales bacterium]
MNRKAFTLVIAIALGAPVVQGNPALAADCTRTHTGRIPLSDLGTGNYMGAGGGLYAAGSNTRPAGHDAAGVSLATNAVRPRNAAGAIDPVNGKIVLISIGMSNTTQEFQRFIEVARTDPDLNPQLTIVDGAQGGQDAIAWSTPNSATWTVLANRLAAAGVTAPQVQTLWLKQQISGDALGAFPGGAQTLRDRLRDIVTIARSKYPNLRIAFLSSRTYGDYNGPVRGKGAYESAFAVKFLLRDQITGDARLAFGASGPAPWLAWGPYLWADGLGSDGLPGGVPGRSDGLEWACADFQSDGIHPSASGRNKVAGFLLSFLKSDTAATPWFRAS